MSGKLRLAISYWLLTTTLLSFGYWLLITITITLTITMTPTRKERRLRRREVYLPKGVLLATLNDDDNDDRDSGLRLLWSQKPKAKS